MKHASLGLAILAAAALSGDTSASSITVPAGGDLQQALHNARGGDTILLERGATYTGNFVVPPRDPADALTVTIRTAGDAGLPAAGQQIGPDAASKLAKLQSPNGSAALRVAPGAQHVRIELLEFLANKNGAGDIVQLGDVGPTQTSADQAPSDLTLDRLYIHGDPQAGQKRGIALNSGKSIITGCYIADIVAIGQDSQAIAGWNGPGPFTIENNHLEAGSENIMFGGGDPSALDLTPSNIVIRNNVLTKPLSWRDPGAPKWQIKNLLELKHARDVLIEKNVLEHSWAQAQTGYAVLFTVRNQDGGCPWCQVENVTFRFNVVRDVGAGVQILGTDSNHPSRQTSGIVIRDNLFDGIDKQAWGGDGYLLQLSDTPTDVTFDHNTIIQQSSGGLIKIANGRADDFAFTNNVGSHGSYGIIGTGHGVGNDSIAAMLPGAAITRNVIAGGRASQYPPGNFFPSADDFQAQFVNFTGHDYHLVPRSPWVNAGTDGRNLGADMSQLPAQKIYAVPRKR